MVRALYHDGNMQKSKSFNFKKMFEKSNHDHGDHERLHFRNHGLRNPGDENQHIGWALELTKDLDPISGLEEGDDVVNTPTNPRLEMESMKERFAKLLLGEDMSGGGKGVSSALALSNAITNLAASVFGEQRKLEPMSPERKSRWRKEIEWLLSVTDHIVELVPTQQKGSNMEIMVTHQRSDLLMNIPALRKLDAMLLSYLDNFGAQNEFWYVSRDADESELGSTPRNDKWWLPTVKVPPNGLSEPSQKWLLYQKELVNQVLKAAMAINAQVLSEMAIPENYIESLPKNGRASLGDLIYKSITDEYFDPVQLLSTLNLSTEHKVLDLKNRIEASIVIWIRKMHHKDMKSSWGSTVSLGKRELFEERAETILLLLKQRFPGLPQSALDTSKIQYNKDVGQAILESYSRTIETLAYTVLSRIEEVLEADSLARDPSSFDGSMGGFSPVKEPADLNPEEDMGHVVETPNSRTLSDFMGWNFNKVDTDMKWTNSTGNLAKYSLDETENTLSKSPRKSPKRPSYLERLENLNGLRSPTARH